MTKEIDPKKKKKPTGPHFPPGTPEPGILNKVVNFVCDLLRKFFK